MCSMHISTRFVTGRIGGDRITDIAESREVSMRLHQPGIASERHDTLDIGAVLLAVEQPAREENASAGTVLRRRGGGPIGFGQLPVAAAPGAMPTARAPRTDEARPASPRPSALQALRRYGINPYLFRSLWHGGVLGSLEQLPATIWQTIST